MLKARIKFRKYGHLKFIGHLDVMRYFQKAMRRAEIPIAFTSGYSPHMIMSFASPLGIGLTSDGEYMDIELREPIASKEAVRRLNEVGIEGIEVLNLVEIEDSKKMGGMSIFAGADYLVYPKNGEFPEHWKGHIGDFLAQDAVNIVKKTKRSEKEVDILPMIYQMEVRSGDLYAACRRKCRESEAESGDGSFCKISGRRGNVPGDRVSVPPIGNVCGYGKGRKKTCESGKSGT